jgi:predicted alpha/beta superfamily hydrolase
MRLTTFYLFIIVLCVGACSKDSDNGNINTTPPPPIHDTLETETFTFLVNGTATEGKIYLPAAYNTNSNLPAIYLIDFTDQHFTVVKNEFEEVVSGVQQIEGFDALSVTLKEHADIDAQHENYQDYYDMFRSMTSYVDNNYTNNTSRTFIGRGSEAGVVMMALFLEDSASSVFDNFIVTDPPVSFMDAIIEIIENDAFPQNKSDKKLHFSFSSSNNQEKCNQLISLLNEAQYPWLEFVSIAYSSDYVSTYPISYSAGLDYIFN